MALWLALIPMNQLLSQPLKPEIQNIFIDSIQYFKDHVNEGGELLILAIAMPRGDFPIADTCDMARDHSYVKFIFWQDNDQDYVLMLTFCDSILKVDPHHTLKKWRRRHEALLKESDRIERPPGHLQFITWGYEYFADYFHDDEIDEYFLKAWERVSLLAPRLFINMHRIKRRMFKLYSS